MNVVLTLIGVAFAGVAALVFLSPKPRKYPRYQKGGEDEIPDYRGVKRVTDPREEQEIRLAKKGLASEPPATIVELFARCRQTKGTRLALVHERNGIESRWSWAEYYNECAGVAKSLMALGQGPQDITNCIGFNCPEWFFADLGSMMAAGIPAGVYTTSNSGSMMYIANHSKAKVIFVESEKYLNKYLEVADKLTHVKYMIVWEHMDDSKLKAADARTKFEIMTWRAFLDRGNDVSDDDLDARMKSVRPGHIAALIYTSGTTGNPKAVMICHDAMTYEGRAMFKTNIDAGYTEYLDNSFRMVSYLPLNHIAAKLADIVLPLVHTCDTDKWGEVWIARKDAMKGSLVNTMQKARPSLFFGVPRVWEKFAEKMRGAAKKTPWPLSALSGYGKKLGIQAYKAGFNDNNGKHKVPLLWPLFNNTLFKMVRQKLGLHHTIQFATGAAPIQPETLEYFGSIGIPITNLYGMSENCGAATMNLLNNYGFGSAGFPMKGIDIKLDHVEGRDPPGNGEILIGGRANMTGYMYEEGKTKNTIDGDGYVHSGDVGMIKDGCLFITGRIKELIIGAGGENIAPVPIEHYLKAVLPALSNIVMIGNQKKYNTMLVSLKVKTNVDTGEPTDILINEATEVSPGCKTVGDAMKDEKWKKYIQGGLDKYNSNPEVCVSRAQKIQYYRIIPTDLNVADETLGPTMKVKRSKVEAKYKDLIDSMY